jgi:hypothetical protein
MAEQSPFITKPYPTIEEVHVALESQGFADNMSTEVYIPMDNSRGPLDESLLRCKSDHLSQDWPKQFKVVVAMMLREAQKAQ